MVLARLLRQRPPVDPSHDFKREGRDIMALAWWKGLWSRTLATELIAVLEEDDLGHLAEEVRSHYETHGSSYVD